MAFGHGAILHSPLQMATIWALGDYHRFATATVWELGPQLVAACGISPGQHVLDVAAGSGNVAIRAARAGARVVASDVTPENFDAGRRAAGEAGVDLEWIEGDAQALPFGDAEFDVVTSCFGAMFAPNHEATARELLRVCRPGGVIGMMNFTPAGAGGDFFRVLGSFAPALPPDARPPLSWGTEEYVRKLFGDRVRSLSATRHEYVERASSSREYFELFKQAFGPMVAIYANLNDRTARELDRAFLEFIERWNRGEGGRVQISYEYLLIVARTS
jgi:ubiquinone/menaquinone biosynthesis C-methylase UbiE